VKYYDRDTIREAIRDILSAKWTPAPSQPDNREDALLDMFSLMTYTVYGAGMREVQQGVIKALDLRHLLGVDAR
jgi:hypothetical protein